MLRDLGIGGPLLAILVIVVVVVILNQTALFGPVTTGSIGVTEETALSWGQNAEATPEVEAEMTPEMEATEEATPESDA